ncbi:MAG: SH3 domain-containing protein [Saprospiraceae bacterium]
MGRRNQRWYNNIFLIIFFCIFIPPVGIYALWKSRYLSRNWDVILTLIIGTTIVLSLNQAKDFNSNSTSLQRTETERATVNMNIYRVVKETSLRDEASSKSRVISRLEVETLIEVIDDEGEWWWKVRYNNKIGWVKKKLLKNTLSQ